MDLSKLTLGEKLVAVGGLVLIIAVFLPWYTVSSGFGGSSSFSIWTGSQGIALLILLGSIVAVGIIALRLFEVLDLSDQGVPEALVVLAAAGVAAVFVLIRVVAIPNYGFGGFLEAAGVNFGRTWGLFVGLIAAIAMAAGAFMKFQEER